MSDIDSLMALEGYEITFEEDSFELVSGGWQVKTIECEAGKQEELLKEMFNGYENVEYIGTDDIPYGVNIFDAEDPNEEGGVRHYLVNDSFYKYLEFNEISVYDLSEVDVSNSHNTFIGFYWEEGTDNIYAFATETDLIIVIYDSRK